MELTETEHTLFIDSLIQKGWSLKNGVIWSPSKGLWFSDVHFRDWTLEDFREIFEHRAERIRNLPHETAQQSAKENQDVSDVASSLLSRTKL